jgi:hypothetical protein
MLDHQAMPVAGARARTGCAKACCISHEDFCAGRLHIPTATLPGASFSAVIRMRNNHDHQLLMSQPLFTESAYHARPTPFISPQFRSAVFQLSHTNIPPQIFSHYCSSQRFLSQQAFTECMAYYSEAQRPTSWFGAEFTWRLGLKFV